MSDQEQNQVNEPLSAYGQPLTFEKVWLMFQETDKKFRETDKKFQETDKSFKETERILNIKFKETDKKLDRVGKMLGNIGNNNADVAESFFYNGLARRLRLGNYKFDYIDRNAHRRRNRVESEYDIILYNKEKVVVLEIKYKLHPDDVAYFIDEKLSKFRRLYPEYNHCKLYGGVAAFDIPEDSRKLAHDKGLFILEQDGKNICIGNAKCFEPAEY
ncbi:MAG: hypothetical protein KJ607_03675 [Bacteroidetes bacterium]|nr:hypothetical protein [Bacteroidota bacterium]